MRVTLYLILTGILISGCDLTGDGDTLITSVAPSLEVNLVNPLDTKSRFGLEIAAPGTYCENARLVIETSTPGNDIIVDVQELEQDPDCTILPTIVSSFLSLDPYPEVSYDLQIIVGGVLKNEGTLLFDDEVYTMEFEEVNGITPGVTELHRIPESIIWGTISNPGESKELFDSFLAQSEAFTNPLGLEIGNYGHFTIGPDQEVNLNADSGQLSNYVYVIRLSHSTENFAAFLAEFRGELPTSATVTCTTWDGQSL